MTGWTRVLSGTHLCAECGCFVTVAWLYYATASTATLCICEPCAEKAAKEVPA